jgi:hypothetical protein
MVSDVYALYLPRRVLVTRVQLVLFCGERCLAQHVRGGCAVQLQALQGLAVAEAAQAAAWSEYENVAAHNEEDMRVFGAQQVASTAARIHGWVEGAAVASENEAEAWLRIARSLGGDLAALDAIAML